MRRCWQIRLRVFLFAIAADCASQGQVASPAKRPDVDLGGAQTITYCEILSHPETFNNKTIRVRALYETDFESAALTAPSCNALVPMTWVEFEESWESRTRWRLRHALANQKWRVQRDVVFIGVFKTDGHYGHMDMYPFLFKVYKVEAVRPFGKFRPLPETK
jgi:hypothetical protein